MLTINVPRLATPASSVLPLVISCLLLLPVSVLCGLSAPGSDAASLLGRKDGLQHPGVIGRAPSLSPSTWPKGDLEKWEGLDDQYNQPKPASRSRLGVVAGSTHASAVHAGRVALDRGGNAMDACLATAAAQVVKAAGSYVSFAGLIDVMYLHAATKKAHNINGVFNTFRGNDPTKFDGNLGATVLVPGFFRGLEKAAADHAKFPLSTLLEPAIYFAEKGMRLNAGVAGLMSLHRDQIMADPSARRAFVNPATGSLWARGERMVQGEVAALLRGVAEKGTAFMYEGDWAREMIEAVNQRGANATLEELVGYRAMTPEVTAVEDGNVTTFLPGPAAPGTTEYGGDSMAHSINLLRVSRGARRGSYLTDATSLFWAVYLIQFAVSTSSVAAIIGDDALARIFPELDMTAPHRLTEEGAREQWEWLQVPGNLKKVATRLWPKREVGQAHHSDNIVAADRDGNVCSINHSINTLPWGTQVWVRGVALPDAGKVNMAFLRPLDWAKGVRLTSALQPAITVHTATGQAHSTIGTIGHSIMLTTPQMYMKMVELGLGPAEAATGPFFFSNFQVPETNGFPPDVVRKVQAMQREQGLDSTLLLVKDAKETASLWSYPTAIRMAAGGVLTGGVTSFGNGYADAQSGE